ncbi:hypothetical protein [Agrobacterium cavarae]|uniref:hypothetical protein n=1 Tax=Agrobacterium cavarae TaxID=2528239 RepID=UPI0028AEAA3F|nr:hypothetical protein [Agrobacterium cavarae]
MWAYVSQYITFENMNFLIGAVGTLLAIWSILKDRVVQKFLYSRRDTTIIGATDQTYNEKLEIRFEGHVVPRLTKTTITLWNGGTKTIDGADIAAADQLRLILPEEVKLISADVSNMSISANNASVKNGPAGEILLQFDYLDPNQGFRIDCLHSGKRRDLCVKGHIKGLGPPKDANYTAGWGAFWEVSKAITFLFVTGGAGLTLAFGINHLISDYVYEFVKIIIGIICTLGTIIGGLIIFDWLGYMDDERGLPRFSDSKRPPPIDGDDLTDILEQ